MTVQLCRVSSRTGEGSAWDEALDNSLIQQAPTVYVSELPSTTAAASSQRLQDFSWTSTVKSEPVLGLHFTGPYASNLVLPKNVAVCSYSGGDVTVKGKARCGPTLCFKKNRTPITGWRNFVKIGPL